MALFPLKYLKGESYICNINDITNSSSSHSNSSYHTASDCFDHGGDWVLSDYNWDNFL